MPVSLSPSLSLDGRTDIRLCMLSPREPCVLEFLVSILVRLPLLPLPLPSHSHGAPRYPDLTPPFALAYECVTSEDPFSPSVVGSIYTTPSHVLGSDFGFIFTLLVLSNSHVDSTSALQ